MFPGPQWLILVPWNNYSSLANKLAFPCQQIGRLRGPQGRHKTLVRLQHLQHQMHPPLVPVDYSLLVPHSSDEVSISPVLMVGTNCQERHISIMWLNVEPFRSSSSSIQTMQDKPCVSFFFLGAADMLILSLWAYPQSGGSGGELFLCKINRQFIFFVVLNKNCFAHTLLTGVLSAT